MNGSPAVSIPTSPAGSSNRKNPTAHTGGGAGAAVPKYQGCRTSQAGKKSRKCGVGVAPGWDLAHDRHGTGPPLTTHAYAAAERSWTTVPLAAYARIVAGWINVQVQDVHAVGAAAVRRRWARGSTGSTTEPGRARCREEITSARVTGYCLRRPRNGHDGIRRSPRRSLIDVRPGLGGPGGVVTRVQVRCENVLGGETDLAFLDRVVAGQPRASPDSWAASTAGDSQAR